MWCGGVGGGGGGSFRKGVPNLRVHRSRDVRFHESGSSAGGSLPGITSLRPPDGDDVTIVWNRSSINFFGVVLNRAGKASPSHRSLWADGATDPCLCPWIKPSAGGQS